MVYTLCFKEVYLDIISQSGCLCVTSTLKAGLHYTMISTVPKLFKRNQNATIVREIKTSKIYMADSQQTRTLYFLANPFKDKCIRNSHPPFETLEKFEPYIVA